MYCKRASNRMMPGRGRDVPVSNCPYYKIRTGLLRLWLVIGSHNYLNHTMASRFLKLCDVNYSHQVSAKSEDQITEPNITNSLLYPVEANGMCDCMQQEASM